ncbi:MAG: flagellar biosynthetic protein FliO [Pseudomonadota bacterium]
MPETTQARSLPRRLMVLAASLAGVAWAGLAWAGEAVATVPPPPTLAEGNLTGAIVKMLAALALVLAVLVGLYWLIRRFLPNQAPGLGGGAMRVIGRLPLGPKRGLALVEVADRVLLLGLGEQNISLLTTIDDQETIRRLTAGRGGFTAALKKAAGGGAEEKP